MTASPTMFRRSPFSRSRIGAVVSAVALVALSAGWVGGGTAIAAQSPNVVPVLGVVVDSVDVCHGTGSDANPYITNQPSAGSIITDPHGHGTHIGPVWTPGIVGAWGDIIPPFTYDLHLGAGSQNYPGLNWDAWGEAIFRNGCNNPSRVAAVTPTVQPSTCVAGVLTSSHYTVPTTTGVIYKVNGVVTAGGTVRSGVAPAFDTLTAVAASTAYFLTNAPFSQRIDFLADAPGCTQVTAVTPTVQPSVCANGVATPSYYDVPSVTGIIWKVGATVVTGTRRSGSAPATETLTAEAAAGYVLTNAPYSQLMTFGADAQNCAPATAVTPTITLSTCVGGNPTTPSYTVPSTVGVVYKVGGNVVTGVRTGTGTETLTAEAATGYTLTNAPFSVVMNFGQLATCTTNATAVAPTVTASSCVAGQATTPSYTVPTTTGVIYQVGGVTVTGVRTGVSKSETLTAVAAPGYALTAPFSTVMTFGPLATGCNPPIVIPTSPDLSIDKAGPASAVKPGDNVAYTLTVRNVGTASASGVQVNDTLPAAMTLVSVSGTGFTCSGTASITCQLAGSLAPGSSAVVNVVTKLAGDYTATAIANTAVVLPTDSNPSNNTDTETTPVTLPTPPVDQDLGISKSGLQGSVAPGDVLSWTVSVKNVAGTPAAAFTVTDVVPDGLTVLSVGGTDWSCQTAGQTVTCTYTGSPLAVGASSAFQLDSVVGADYAGSTVSNTAVVDPGGVDATNDSATAVTPVVFTGGGGGTVVEPTPSPSPSPSGGGQALPFTGSYTDRTLSTGVAILLVGLFLALAGRRRRSS